MQVTAVGQLLSPWNQMQRIPRRCGPTKLRQETGGPRVKVISRATRCGTLSRVVMRTLRLVLTPTPGVCLLEASEFRALSLTC